MSTENNGEVFQNDPDMKKKLNGFMHKLKRNFGNHNRILGAATEMINKANIAKNSGLKVINAGASTAVKAYNRTFNLVYRLPFILLLLYILTLYGFGFFGLVHEQIINILSLDIFSNILSQFQIFWIAVLTIVFLFIAFVTFMIPMQNTGDVLRIEFEWYLVIMFLMVIIGLIFGSFFENEDPIDVIDGGIQEGTKKSMSLWEQITCSFTPECLREMMTENEAEVSKNVVFNIDFKPPVTSSTYLQLLDLEEGLPLYYSISSTTEVNISEIRCYFEKKTNDNLFDTIEVNQKIRTAVDGKYLVENAQCNTSAIIDKLDENDKSYRIITTMIINMNTVYNKETPLVDYQRFVSEDFDLDESKEYSYGVLKTKLDELVTENDKEFIESTQALTVSTVGLDDNLPLLLNDGKEREFSFTLQIEGNSDNNFGDLIIGEIKDITLPKGLLFAEDRTIEDYTERLEFDNDKYENIIRIKEDESATTNNKKVDSTDMKIEIMTTFEKENRFSITVKDDKLEEMLAEEEEEEQYEEGTYSSSSNLNPSFENTEESVNRNENMLNDISLSYSPVPEELYNQLAKIRQLEEQRRTKITMEDTETEEYQQIVDSLRNEYSTLENMLSNLDSSSEDTTTENGETDVNDQTILNTINSNIDKINSHINNLKEQDNTEELITLAQNLLQIENQRKTLVENNQENTEEFETLTQEYETKYAEFEEKRKEHIRETLGR